MDKKQNIWFSADTHINHKNICKYCNRPFKTIEEMNGVFIDNWNNVVKKNDIVYFLGDFCFDKDPMKYISRLNGNINFIWGNHDKQLKRVVKELSNTNQYNFRGDIVEINIDKVPYVLCHYPLESWNRSCHGSIHLHGHTHGTSRIIKNRLDVGVDNVYKIKGIYRPLNLVEINDILSERNILTI